jgi:anti-anti-sigma factor
VNDSPPVAFPPGYPADLERTWLAADGTAVRIRPLRPDDIDRELRAKPARLYVDLGAVDSFDSAGLGGVVAGMRAARAAGVELKLRGLSQPMLDFFSLVSVQRLVKPDQLVDRPDPVTRLGAFVEPMVDGAVTVAGTAVAVLQELLQ